MAWMPPLPSRGHPNAPTLRNKLLMLPAKFIVSLPVSWSLAQSHSLTISLCPFLSSLPPCSFFPTPTSSTHSFPFFVASTCFCCCYFSCSALGKLVLCGCLPCLLFLLEILLLPISGKHTHTPTHIYVFRVCVCVRCVRIYFQRLLLFYGNFTPFISRKCELAKFCFMLSFSNSFPPVALPPLSLSLSLPFHFPV